MTTNQTGVFDAGGRDQVIFQFDGNNNDPEDIAAMPIAAAAGFSRSLSIATHSNEGRVEDTTEALVAMLNSGEKVLILEGGPMTATHDALARLSAENHSNIAIVTHSVWNEGHACSGPT